MAGRKKLSAEDMLELDIKAMLRGGLQRIGGAARLGEELMDLGASTTEGGMPTNVPDSIRAGVLKEFARLMGMHGDGGASNSLVDDEALDARLAQLMANAPMEEEPFDDDDASD